MPKQKNRRPGLVAGIDAPGLHASARDEAVEGYNNDRADERNDDTCEVYAAHQVGAEDHAT